MKVVLSTGYAGNTAGHKELFSGRNTRPQEPMHTDFQSPGDKKDAETGRPTREVRVRLSVIYAVQDNTAVDVAVLRDKDGFFVPYSSASKAPQGRQRVDIPKGSLALVHEGCIHAGSFYRSLPSSLLRGRVDWVLFAYAQQTTGAKSRGEIRFKKTWVYLLSSW